MSNDTLGVMSKADVNVDQINATSRAAYHHEGPGIGGNKDVKSFFKSLVGREYNTEDRVLDIGFGEGYSLVHANEAGAKEVVGVDLAMSSIANLASIMGAGNLVANGFTKTFPTGQIARAIWADVCMEGLPLEDNYFDIAICTEAIEHMPNPYLMVSEVKRVLKPEGLFLLAFPDPDDNLGYGGGQHAHVYPWFLRKPSFERFMMQLYFSFEAHQQNGSSAWYVYSNYKGPGIVDTFKMIAGNYEENQLYGMLKKGPNVG